MISIFSDNDSCHIFILIYFIPVILFSLLWPTLVYHSWCGTYLFLSFLVITHTQTNSTHMKAFYSYQATTPLLRFMVFLCSVNKSYSIIGDLSKRSLPLARDSYLTPPSCESSTIITILRLLSHISFTEVK